MESTSSPQVSKSDDKAEASSSTTKSNDVDRVFQYDEEEVDKLRNKLRQETDVKFLKSCRVSALAAMKMLKHALSGVDKGRKRGTNPVEVMGLLLGKPEGDSIIVTDACALPVEGTETRVIADDCQVYMVDLSEALENTRKEKFVGWYHSHPFDVESYSHCHLSATDVQTQFLWQSQSPYWCAIVVDPLRSLAKQLPEFGCYRCYPVNHHVPKTNCPDGTIMEDEQARMQRWGVTSDRYYELNISYFMSSIGHSALNIMSRNTLWINVLSSTAMLEPENRSRFADRVTNISTKITSRTSLTGNTRSPSNKKIHQNERDLVTKVTSDLALEQIKGQVSQMTKNYVFNQ